MSVATFIPEVWNGRLLRALEKDLVFGQAAVINTDYEGDIAKHGDTVHIGSVGAVTIRDYTRNEDIEPPEELSTTDATLLIDQAKYYNFAVDDVDARQAAGNLMGPGMQEAAYGLADTADAHIAGLVLATGNGIPEANLLGEAGDPIEVDTAAKAYDYLVDMSVLLDEAKVPKRGRWAVIPPWWDGLLAKDERVLRSMGADVIPNGFSGRVRGMVLLNSLNLPSTDYDGESTVIAGHPIAWSFAQQINQSEAYRPEARFADAVKGLHLYGSKIVRPSCLVVATAARE